MLHRYTATAINNLASLYRQQGRAIEAERLWIEVLKIREQTLGPEHVDLVNVIYYLTKLYHEQDRLEDAGYLLERIKILQESRSGKASPRQTAMMNELVAFQQQQQI